MKKLFYLFPLLIILAGCGTTAKFVYPSDMNELIQLESHSIYNKDIAVLPFKDFRSDYNSMGTIALFFIPLSPYGWVSYDRPDAARRFSTIRKYECNVSEDLSKAFATSLRRSNLFQDAFFTFGGQRENSDFFITGKVYTYYYKGRNFSYGLSTFGPYLWILGAPLGTSLNRIELKLALHNSDTKEVLWEYKIKKEDYHIQGLYYNFGKDVKLFTKLIQNGYNKALLDLQKQLRENPKDFGLQ